MWTANAMHMFWDNITLNWSLSMLLNSSLVRIVEILVLFVFCKVYEPSLTLQKIMQPIFPNTSQTSYFNKVFITIAFEKLFKHPLSTNKRISIYLHFSGHFHKVLTKIVYQTGRNVFILFYSVQCVMKGIQEN